MEWSTYRKAKEIEEHMWALEDVMDQKLNPPTHETLYPLYSFLNQREDFREYIRNVYEELKKEFEEL